MLVALDRDGTIIEERPYLSDPRQVRLLPNAADGIRALRQIGFRVVLVTNQSGVGHGYFGLETLGSIHQQLIQLLAEAGATVDGVYFCPHLPAEGCACRKPEAGLLEQAARDFGLLPQEAFVVGDKQCDIEMGRRAGATTLLVRTGWGPETAAFSEVQPHFLAEDLWEAAQVIASLSSGVGLAASMRLGAAKGEALWVTGQAGG